MKIASDSAMELVLTSGTMLPSALSGLLATVLFVAAIPTRMPMLLGGTCLFALVSLLCMRSSRVTLDKHARTVTIDRWKWFRRDHVRLSFDDITDVVIELDSTPMTPNMHISSRTGRLCLSTQQGSRRLADLYDTNPKHDPDRRAILATLGRSMLETTPDQSVLHLVRAGRITEALEMLRSQERLDIATARSRIAAMERQVAVDEQRTPPDV